MSNAKIISIIAEASRAQRTEAQADIAALLNAVQEEITALEFQLDTVRDCVRKLEEGVPN